MRSVKTQKSVGHAAGQDGPVDAAKLHGYSEGDGLIDGFAGGRDHRAEPAAGVLFNFAGRVVLGLDDNGQAAGMPDEDVGALGRGVGQHAGLFDADAVAPAGVPGSQQAGEFDVDGVFGGAGHAGGGVGVGTVWGWWGMDARGGDVG